MLSVFLIRGLQRHLAAISGGSRRPYPSLEGVGTPWVCAQESRQPGYLKALEHGNSVPRPKEFCEADKEKNSAVLSQIKNVAIYT